MLASKLLTVAVLCFALGVDGATVPEDVQTLNDAPVAAVQVDEDATEGLFQEFMAKHSKRYTTVEEQRKRKKIFAESLRFVNEWNKGKHSFKVSMNEFADLTGKEFADQYLSRDLEERGLAARSVDMLSDTRELGEDVALRNGMMHENSGETLPKSVDWSKHAGKVYKQGVCAACYTFTTTAAIESEFHIKTGKHLPELSSQQILSCSKDFGNHGCLGGNMEKSYHYLMHSKGLAKASAYPYAGSATPCADKNLKRYPIKLAGFRKIQRGSEDDLQDALAQRPVAVGIDAHHPAFKLYDSGVFDVDYCTAHLTHAVLVVGYGEENGKKFWKIKNSWGKEWGTNGYGKMARGKNLCAISNLGSYPVLDQPETWALDTDQSA